MCTQGQSSCQDSGTALPDTTPCGSGGTCTGGACTGEGEPGAAWDQVTNAAGWSKRSGHVAVVFNNKIWLMGGMDGSTYYCLNDVWNTEDGVTWTQVLANNPTPAATQFPGRCSPSLLVFDGKMWLLGGDDSRFHQTNDVWSSSDGVTWTKVANAEWPPRVNQGALVYGGKMWIMGGYGQNAQGYATNLQDVWSSPNGITWTQATAQAQWTKRRSFVSLVFNDGTGEKMWILGGMGGGIAMPTFDDEAWTSSDGVTWTMKSADNGLYARNTATGVVFANRMFVMGGLVEAHNIVSSSTDGINWTEVTPDVEWPARMESTSVVYKNKMWVMGGTFVITNSIYYNDVWVSR